MFSALASSCDVHNFISWYLEIVNRSKRSGGGRKKREDEKSEASQEEKSKTSQEEKRVKHRKRKRVKHAVIKFIYLLSRRCLPLSQHMNTRCNHQHVNTQCDHQHMNTQCDHQRMNTQCDQQHMNTQCNQSVETTEFFFLFTVPVIRRKVGCVSTQRELTQPARSGQTVRKATHGSGTH